MEILKKKKVNGKEVVYEFNPDFKMRAFAYAIICDPNYAGKEPHFVMNQIGLSRHLLDRWRRDFDPYFTEWVEDMHLLLRSKNTKKMLEFIGLERAFKGDFQFWKPFAIKHKVIDPDQMNHGVIPSSLGAFNEWSDEQVEQHRNTLLQSLRAVEGEGGSPLAEGDLGREREGDPCRASPLQKEPLALDASVGTDGEYSLEDDLAF